jgi:hypothetical protein
MDPETRIAELIERLERISDQRNRYRDALVRSICARTIADARKIIRDAFREDNQCNKPHSQPDPSA